jgi:hypothetical protein
VTARIMEEWIAVGERHQDRVMKTCVRVGPPRISHVNSRVVKTKRSYGHTRVTRRLALLKVL